MTELTIISRHDELLYLSIFICPQIVALIPMGQTGMSIQYLPRVGHPYQFPLQCLKTFSSILKHHSLASS